MLKAIGITAASVTGPTSAAAAAAILADGTLVAPRALNAFQVGVVGLLNVIPAAADGLPWVLTALQTARQDTFTALNLPIVPNPTPTVMPEGVVQVAVISAINVGAAVIFPAFNEVLGGVFEVPDAVAQELAASGDPVRALAAGADTAGDVVREASSIIEASIVKAASDIRTAIEQARPDNATTLRQASQLRNPDTTKPPRADVARPRRMDKTTLSDGEASDSHPVRDVVTKVRQSFRGELKKAANGPVRSIRAERKPTRTAPHRAESGPSQSG